jgi:CxxC motif-containing protein
MSTQEKKFICIRCPRGCEILTSLDGYGAITEIHGNVCKLGRDYVQAELTDPRRTLTTTVRVRHGRHPLVPVWTAQPVPKERVLELADVLRGITLEAPVTLDQVVLENALGLDIDVVASGSVELVRT